MDLYGLLFGSTWKLAHSLSTLVSASVARGIRAGGATPEVAMEDFFFYCVAKGSKHIRAALLLIENDLPEDAIVVCRAAYECYVCAAYARTHGIKAVDELVFNPVGLGAGTVEFARTKKGGWNYRSLIDRETGTSYVAAPSIERMAASTGNSNDASVHRYFYSFASEHVHVNMSGSGNYRNGERYTDEGSSQTPNAIFLLAYVSVILVELAVSRSATDEGLRWEIERDINAVAEQIEQVLRVDESAAPADFDTAMMARLDAHLNTPPFQGG